MIGGAAANANPRTQFLHDARTTPSAPEPRPRRRPSARGVELAGLGHLRTGGAFRHPLPVFHLALLRTSLVIDGVLHQLQSFLLKA